MKELFKRNRGLIFFLLFVLLFFWAGWWILKIYLPYLIHQIYKYNKFIPLLSNVIKREVFDEAYYLALLEFSSEIFQLLVIIFGAMVIIFSYKNKQVFLPKITSKNFFERETSLVIVILLFYGYAYWIRPHKFIGIEKVISIYSIILLFLFLLLRRDGLFFSRLQRLVDFFLAPLSAFVFAVFFNLYGFFKFFPLKYFDSIPFYDDYAFRFAFLVRGIEILKQGAIFGWDSKLLGGYPTVFNLTDNFHIIFLPFTVFGYRIGFHLMLLFFWLLFPFLIYSFIVERFRNKKAACISLYISFFFNMSFFKVNILSWGMVNNYIAINLFVMALIFALRTKEGKRFSFLLLFLVLFFLMYAHIGIFFFTIIFIGVELLLPWRKTNFVKFIGLLLSLFLAGFNYLYYFLRYKDFFVFNTSVYRLKESASLINFFPVGLNLGVLYANWFSYATLVGIFLPLLLVLLFKLDSGRKYVFYTIFILLLFSFRFSLGWVEAFLNRMIIFLPFLFTTVFSLFLSIYLEKKNYSFLFLFLASAVYLFPFFFSPTPHIDNIYEFNRPLVTKLADTEVNKVLLEAHSPSIKPRIIKSPFKMHFEALITQTLKKPLLTTTGDGYALSIFRDNVLVSGVFRGRPLNEVEVDEFNRFLDKWGIENIVVWSRVAKDYFQQYPQLYKEERIDRRWTTFRYKYAREGNITFLGNRGKGTLTNNDYFEKILELKDVDKGETVVLRTNYFPEWRAFYEDRPIPIFNLDGQLAIQVPFDGEGEILFRYPKHCLFTLLIFFAFALAIIVEGKLLNRVRDFGKTKKDTRRVSSLR